MLVCTFLQKPVVVFSYVIYSLPTFSKVYLYLCACHVFWRFININAYSFLHTLLTGCKSEQSVSDKLYQTRHNTVIVKFRYGTKRIKFPC
jgi:hypothetical protein